MRNRLFDSIIQTSGADTDDIHSGEAEGNFWAENQLFECVLREMADLAARAMIKFIDTFFYEIAHAMNFRKAENEPFDPANFPIRDLIRKTYEHSSGDNIVELVEPPEENEWIQAVIDGLRENLDTVSEYNRVQYTGVIDYIEKNDLLRVVLNEIRREYLQRNAQGEH